MRTYSELTPDDQAEARHVALVELLEGIIEGGVRFNDEDNGDDLQARIDAACARADEMQTPWFSHEYILDTCRAELEGMAACDAEDALYPESNERIIRVACLSAKPDA